MIATFEKIFENYYNMGYTPPPAPSPQAVEGSCKRWRGVASGGVELQAVEGSCKRWRGVVLIIS